MGFGVGFKGAFLHHLFHRAFAFGAVEYGFAANRAFLEA
jgi:hypothetical protein